MVGFGVAGPVADTTALTALSPRAQAVLTNVNRILVGQANAAQLAVISLLAGGHLILEDVPGLGKTLLAKTVALSIHGQFKRVQCTPDLLPSDICGANIYDQKEGIFKFIPGPVFTNVLLTDEINRATPRTQSSLLEAMEERQVTTDGITRALPPLFFVIATQNPVEQHGTFSLPEAQLDRFMMALSLGYPQRHDEATILKRTMEKDAFIATPVISVEELLQARAAAAQVYVHDSIVEYILDIVTATRSQSFITLGVSPRGAQLLMRASQASAFLEGRDHVTPNDVKRLAPYVLGHRIIPKVKGKRISHVDLINRIVQTVAVPS